MYVMYGPSSVMEIENAHAVCKYTGARGITLHENYGSDSNQIHRGRNKLIICEQRVDLIL